MKEGALARISHAVGAEAAARDEDGQFPVSAIETLRAGGLIRSPPVDPRQIRHLLRVLAAVGRGDLSVGRLYEGHVNSVFLIQRFGDGAARDIARRLLGGDAFFGIWNTDAGDDPLRIEEGAFYGKKSFASGADGLSHALVTVGDLESRQMFLVPIEGLPVDRRWWRPLGMRASGSHVVDFTGLAVDPSWQIGRPGDYTREPWLSAGALRFLAVQVGGMHAVLDATKEHLVRSRRDEDRIQRQRLAAMAVCVETAYLWLDRAAEGWAEPSSRDTLIAGVCAARGAVERAALALLEDAERSIGVAAMVAPHAYERLSRDLRTYLRQPNPDGAAERLGKAVAESEWNVGAGFGAS